MRDINISANRNPVQRKISLHLLLRYDFQTGLAHIDMLDRLLHSHHIAILYKWQSECVPVVPFVDCRNGKNSTFQADGFYIPQRDQIHSDRNIPPFERDAVYGCFRLKRFTEYIPKSVHIRQMRRPPVNAVIIKNILQLFYFPLKTPAGPDVGSDLKSSFFCQSHHFLAVFKQFFHFSP